MKAHYKTRLRQIKTLIFDVDGVMTDSQLILLPDGSMVRSMNARDGYALEYALKKGMHIAIITGGRNPMVKNRLEKLGITDIYLDAQNKREAYEDFCARYALKAEEMLYMGDDILDMEVMQCVGISSCPADAVPEVQAIADYISPLKGGKGCVRDVVEQTLKVKGLWP